MAKRWIVDGMNVIGSRPDGWWRDRSGAMRALAAQLDRFQDDIGEPVAVVYDGRPREIPARVEVRFASRAGRNAADDEIARMVAADAAPGEVRVVTSDGDLATRVRAAGAEVEGAGTFRRRLDAAEV
jgi:predicted RNA-binding protein with PIN domain